MARLKPMSKAGAASAKANPKLREKGGKVKCK